MGYEILKEAEIIPFESNSGVSDQPKSLEETIKGAINRAKFSFKDCHYSFGIESGLMSVPETKTGYMNFCACAIYDGSQIHLGMSSAFEFPKKITKIIHSLEIGANEAAHRLGLTNDKKIGSSQGIIGLLTKGRVTRKDYTIQAIRMALIHLENPELYR